MAKDEENPFLDINANIMGRLENIPDATSVEIEEDEKDDEFEKLLNTFIAAENSDTNEEKQQIVEQSEKQLEKEPKIVYGNDEGELAQAYTNFIDAVTAIAAMRQIDFPKLSFVSESLVPNYKPSLGKKIVSDTLACWDIMLAAFPDTLSTLNPNASDEQLLNFAEGLADQNLQLAVISYVEILIDIENCEISYEERRLKSQRKRVERALYEEYMRRQERKRRFVEALQAKNFPIDSERLINNYFKTASKDAPAAFEVLTTNPAMYAPIENDKIKPRFFGLVKVTPQDGIRENHKIGSFLKKVKA
ncbi:MAG: hypothetical protein J5895_03695 [Alphaproteobacteria bacterium]|nr:hypothetical protein [Alphaproteobacteria bacterium]